MRSGFHNARMWHHNRANAIQMIQRCGPLSRKALAQQLALSPAALTRIASDLLRAGIVKESPELRLDRDLPRSRLTLNAEWGHIVTLSLVHRPTAGVIDFAGRLVHSEHLASDETARRRYREDFDRTVQETAARLIERQGDRRVLGIGILSAGYVDTNGIIRNNAYLPRPDVDMRQVLAPVTGLPVVTDEESRLLLMTSLWRSNISDEEVVVALNLRPDGLGGPQTACIKGQILNGKDGMAGSPGWRLAAVAENILDEVARLGGEDRFIERVMGRDAEARPIFEKVIHNYALRVAQAVNVFNPHRIFLYSEYAALGQPLLDQIRELARAETEPRAFDKTEIILSGRRTEEERLVAAATPLLQSAFSHDADTEWRSLIPVPSADAREEMSASATE